MAACQTCGAALPGRQQKCARCKTATGRPVKRTPPKPRPGSRKPRKKAAAAKSTAKRAPAGKKAAAKKTTPAVATPPPGLQPRGRALWTALGQKVDSPAGQLALEACRLADRLEDLDRVITGKGVLQLLTFRLDHAFDVDSDTREIHVQVEFSKPLAEARQQQLAFTRVLAELGVSKAKVAPAAPAKPGPTNPLDELSARRQQREQEA